MDLVAFLTAVMIGWMPSAGCVISFMAYPPSRLPLERSPVWPGRLHRRLGLVVTARPMLMISPENAVPGIGSILNALVPFGIMTISLVAGLVITRGSLACIFRVMTYAAARQHAPIADPQPAFIPTLVHDIAA